ncbi:MAG: peptide deformylase [Proteobacteria bacterium]|nr:peptide deformylase [Pseudomonadota bacterium]
MAVREVLVYPDPRLKQVSAPVTDLGDSLAALVADLRDTLASRPGVGIAAPQIGEMRRVVLIDVSQRFPERPARIFVNPEILEVSDKRIFREGCMSIPDFTANVLRGYRVRVRALDEHGQPFELDTDELEAIAIQHECDHLDGLLFLDRVASLKTDVFRRKGVPKSVPLPT